MFSRADDAYRLIISVQHRFYDYSFYFIVIPTLIFIVIILVY